MWAKADGDFSATRQPVQRAASDPSAHNGKRKIFAKKIAKKREIGATLAENEAT